MSSDLKRDEYWMQYALNLAQQAELAGEVPVGAVLVRNDMLLAEGWNQSIQRCDPTAHAEIVALRAGALKSENYRLLETTLYVTLEPCVMCLGALAHARVQRLVFGATDLKTGALNHHVQVEGGVLASATGDMLRDFFKKKR
jgi:tRNA(adenine34) deaminase